jgi:hypothetical protein
LALSSFGGHECIKRSGGLQVGGGITDKNALSWIECGASKVSLVISNLDTKQSSSVQVIVTSYLFPEQKFSLQRLQTISSLVGKERLVVDIRCVCRLVSRQESGSGVKQLPTERAEVVGSNEQVARHH